MTSPTARSLDWLRDAGYTAQVVEKWIGPPQIEGAPYNPMRRRIDLFGGIDIVAIGGHIYPGGPGWAPIPNRPWAGVLGVQSTSDNGGNVAAHVTKLLGLPALKLWLECGNRLVVHGWAKKARPWKEGEKRSGVRTKRWTLREVPITLDMYNTCVQHTPDV